MYTNLVRAVAMTSTIAALGFFGTSLNAEDSFPDTAQLIADAEEYRKTLDPFFKQHVVMDGLLIVASEKVSPYALREVAYQAKQVLAKRPDVLKHMCVTRKMYVCVLAHTEMQNELPDCSHMNVVWNYRVRGIGHRPASCGEENVLGFKGDPFEGDNIFIHEYAHVMHGSMAARNEGFNERLKALHAEAKETGRVRGYAMDSAGEFFAEGAQAWFNCNGVKRLESCGGGPSFEVLDSDGEHLCHIQTREQVKKHLPKYAELLAEAFGDNEWTYVPISKRWGQPHLKGYDPSKAPTFRWPEEVVEGYKKAMAEEAAKKNK